MRTRLIALWFNLRNSLWFIPTVMAVLALILSEVTLAIDRRVSLGDVALLDWVYAGGPEGARTLLGAAAGATIGIAGVVFSIVMVVLSLASSQLGPRLLANFIRDTTNQVVLGTFVAAFLYTLLVLRTIRTVDEGLFLPSLSVTLAMAISISSLGVLIYFTSHVATSIQAPIVAARIGGNLLRATVSLFPQDLGYDRATFGCAEGVAHGDFQIDVPSLHQGYIQVIDQDALLAAAVREDVILELRYRPGQFIARDIQLIRVWADKPIDGDLVDELNNLFVVGAQRTDQQDVEYAVRQLVEIALRAMSPAINDPFTAMTCIDWLGAALIQLAGRRFPSGDRYDEDGRLRAVVHPERFEGILDAAFSPIRQASVANVAVMIRMLEVIAQIAERADDDHEKTALLKHASRIQRGCQRAITDPDDRADIDGRFQRVMALIQPDDAP